MTIKTYKALRNISKVLREQIEDTIEYHDKYKNAYFWSPGASASQRRWREHSFPMASFNIHTLKGNIAIRPTYQETCEHVYYKLAITVDNEPSTIRAIKNLLKGV